MLGEVVVWFTSDREIQPDSNHEGGVVRESGRDPPESFVVHFLIHEFPFPLCRVCETCRPGWFRGGSRLSPTAFPPSRTPWRLPRPGRKVKRYLPSSANCCSLLWMVQSETWGLLTELEAADMLAVSPDTLRTWRSARKGPPYIKLKTGGVRYDQTELRVWIDGQRVDPSASTTSG